MRLRQALYSLAFKGGWVWVKFKLTTMRKVLYVIFFFSSILLINGCKKESSNTTEITNGINPISNKPFEEQKSYIKKNLKIATTEFAKAMRDPEIKKIVDAQALLQKKGDYTVRLADLMTLPNFKNKVNIENLNQAINAFKGIEGKDKQLEVYVPRFAKANNVSNQFYEDIDELEYVIPSGDETEEILPGYELNDNEMLELSGKFIDEYYASTKPVYLIYFSEDEFGQNYSTSPSNTPFITNEPIGPQPSYSFGVGNEIINIKIDKMGVRCLKEAWWKGKADVAIRADKHTWNGKVDGNSGAASVDYGSNRSTTDFRGIEIFKFPRVSVDNIPIDVYKMNYNLQFQWNVTNADVYPIIYTYVIFEADDWPAKQNIKDVNPFPAHFPTESRFVKFRSGDDEYYRGSFYATNKNWPSSYTTIQNVSYYPNGELKQFIEDNNCIKYNITQY